MLKSPAIGGINKFVYTIYMPVNESTIKWAADSTYGMSENKVKKLESIFDNINGNLSEFPSEQLDLDFIDLLLSGISASELELITESIDYSEYKEIERIVANSSNILEVSAVSLTKQRLSMEAIYSALEGPLVPVDECLFVRKYLGRLNLKDKHSLNWIFVAEERDLLEKVIILFADNYKQSINALNAALEIRSISEFYCLFQSLGSRIENSIKTQINTVINLDLDTENAFAISMSKDIFRLVFNTLVQQINLNTTLTRIQKINYIDNFANFLKAPEHIRTHLLKQYFNTISS